MGSILLSSSHSFGILQKYILNYITIIFLFKFYICSIRISWGIIHVLQSEASFLQSCGSNVLLTNAPEWVSGVIVAVARRPGLHRVGSDIAPGLLMDGSFFWLTCGCWLLADVSTCEASRHWYLAYFCFGGPAFPHS